ncbi:hypothetical protein [Streptomyces galilaeus]|uniref:hypothetical protein n=1 Tax=Streptomyces galilaeus TaxID=33899 RepID=UPI00142F06ED|nr:hypothetical protein [Streptomyces galilaeus]
MRLLPVQLPLQHRDLMAQSQDLHVHVPIAHRQQPQHREGARHAQVHQSQQPGRSSCLGDRQSCQSGRRRRSGRHPANRHALAPASADDVIGKGNLTERIGALPGVHRAETEIVAQWIKRVGPLVATRA